MKSRIVVFLIITTVCLLLYPGCNSTSSTDDSNSGTWSDVHGAGCQRSDPKSGSLSDYGYAGGGYYNVLAPQGDAVRIHNFIRLVRDVSGTSSSGTYNIVDTNQTTFYGSSEGISSPVATSDAFYGQDAQFSGNQPDYTVSGDNKTVFDNVTGLTWMKGPNSDLSVPVASDKMTYSEALVYVDSMNIEIYGGYSDWRLPSVKELYSLILFSGIDISGYETGDTSELTPFINNTAFNFSYGDTTSNERLIDSQYLSSNVYVYTGNETLYFGVNFADGRIKGYGAMIMNQEKTFFVQLVRGNTLYGVNDYTDNGDNTITDSATGLMWAKDDSGEGMTWEDSLAWVQTKNTENYLGYSDWRLPNAKEMHSIVDYSSAPDYDNNPAIDTMFFNSTSIINENGDADFPWYWTGTTHETMQTTGAGSAAVYISFGRAMGYSLDEVSIDVP